MANLDEIDEPVKSLITELGMAIHDVVQESDAVNSVVNEIRASGFDVILCLEAQVGLSRIEGFFQKALPAPSPTVYVKNGKIKADAFGGNDEVFLRSLRINLGDEQSPSSSQ